jgi:cell division protease FtsH
MVKEEILKKQSELFRLKATLKSQFFGIDEVIDQVVESITSWYTFPELQTRPLVINLWGMTGVGKSELIKQLVKQLNFEDRYFQFDCGEFGLRDVGGIRDIFGRLSKIGEIKPHIFLLDEFQINRSISENGAEVLNKDSRVIWQLLDDGKISFFQEWYHLEDHLEEMYMEFIYWVESGLKVRNGIVSSDSKEYLYSKRSSELMGKSDHEKVSYFETEENRFIFPNNEMDTLYQYF